jgi:hypothetical protein
MVWHMSADIGIMASAPFANKLTNVIMRIDYSIFASRAKRRAYGEKGAALSRHAAIARGYARTTVFSVLYRLGTCAAQQSPFATLGSFRQRRKGLGDLAWHSATEKSPAPCWSAPPYRRWRYGADAAVGDDNHRRCAPLSLSSLCDDTSNLKDPACNFFAVCPKRTTG